MSLHESDQEEEEGAVAGPSLTERLAELRVEEPAICPRWSWGVGQKEEPEELQAGVTRRRPKKKPVADWSGTGEEDYKISHAMRLLEEEWTERRIRERAVERELTEELEQKYSMHSLRESGGAEGGCAQENQEPVSTPAARDIPRAGGGRRRWMAKVPPLSIKYDGDPKSLGLFIIQVWNYMEIYGPDLETDEIKVRMVLMALEKKAAEWMVGLHKCNSPLLRNFDEFMAAMRRRFDDPLTERRAQLKFTSLTQGKKTVPDYVQEFQELSAYMRGWSEEALLDQFAEGLDKDVYQQCINRRLPRRLAVWYENAADVELDLARLLSSKPPGDNDELRLILVGKSGSGKSATGNTILGRPAFKSLVAAKTSTMECQKEQGTWKKRNIYVIDTPPIFDSKELEQSLKKQLENCRHMCQSGLHVFILVIQVGCFADEDMAAAKHVWKIFGDESASCTIVLFTHKEDLGGDSLKNYIKKANNQYLCEVMYKCDHRLCGFNNKAEEDEREKQLSELMEMVEKIDKENGGKPYFIPQGDELWLILVGKSGGGKSATGNTILGRLAFKSLLAAKPTTVQFQKEQGTCEGRKISVIDTPAIFDSKWLEESLAKDLENSLHVFIFVTQVRDFTAEDEAAAEKVWKIFGEESANRTIVLFTCKEDLGGYSLKNCVKEAKNKYLRQLIKKCNHRFCGFNNKAMGQERQEQVSELIEMVEEIVTKPRQISPTSLKKAEFFFKTKFSFDRENQK